MKRHGKPNIPDFSQKPKGLPPVERGENKPHVPPPPPPRSAKPPNTSQKSGRRGA